MLALIIFLWAMPRAFAGEITIGVNPGAHTASLGYVLYSYQQQASTDNRSVIYDFPPWQVWTCVDRGQRELRLPDFDRLGSEEFFQQFGCFSWEPSEREIFVHISPLTYTTRSAQSGFTYYWCNCHTEEQRRNVDAQFQNLEQSRSRERR